MSTNRLKDKIKAGKKLIGTHANMTDPCLCDIYGRLGFDFVWIDCEHSSLSFQDVLAHLNAASRSGLSTIVRVPRDDYNYTKRILEMGPDGIIFPMVASKEEADRVMQYTLYPPNGIRGFGPARAIQYGCADALDYVDNTSKDLVRMIQIEDVATIDALPEIVKNPWLDACIFGPNDLSGSLGHVGRGLAANTQEQIRRGIEVLKEAIMPYGVSLSATDQETLTHYACMGMNILSVGADYCYIIDGARTAYVNANASFAHATK